MNTAFKQSSCRVVVQMLVNNNSLNKYHMPILGYLITIVGVYFILPLLIMLAGLSSIKTNIFSLLFWFGIEMFWMKVVGATMPILCVIICIILLGRIILNQTFSGIIRHRALTNVYILILFTIVLLFIKPVNWF